MNKNLIDFKIGTDIEFLWTYKGKLVKSSNYTGQHDALGSDANGRTVEVRSLPSEDPLQVVNSIKNIMQEAVNQNPLFFEWKWVAGSYIKNLPLGFHVHFGLKPKVISPEYVVPYLDNYLGSISLLLENYGEGVNRRSYKKSPGGNPVSYGKMGDFRTKPHGFEYRPISSCISSPYVTLSLLCLAKAIVFEALNNKAFKPRLLVEHDDFTHMNIAKIKTNFPQIWQDITQLHLYPKYKSHIDFLLFLIQNKDSWKQGNEDFKLNWGIINSSKYFKKNDLYIKLPVNIKPVIEEEVDNEKPGKILQLEDIWGEMILGKNNQF